MVVNGFYGLGSISQVFHLLDSSKTIIAERAALSLCRASDNEHGNEMALQTLCELSETQWQHMTSLLHHLNSTISFSILKVFVNMSEYLAQPDGVSTTMHADVYRRLIISKCVEGIAAVFVESVRIENYTVAEEALIALGNFACGNSNICTSIADMNVIPVIFNMTMHASLRENAINAILNFAEEVDCVRVLEKCNALQTIFKKLKMSPILVPEDSPSQEGVDNLHDYFLILNLSERHSRRICAHILNQGGIDLFLAYIEVDDGSMQSHAVDALYLLTKDEDVGHTARVEIYRSGRLKNIIWLLSHINNAVKSNTMRLLRHMESKGVLEFATAITEQGGITILARIQRSDDHSLHSFVTEVQYRVAMCIPKKLIRQWMKTVHSQSNILLRSNLLLSMCILSVHADHISPLLAEHDVAEAMLKLLTCSTSTKVGQALLRTLHHMLSPPKVPILNTQPDLVPLSGSCEFIFDSNEPGIFIPKSNLVIYSGKLYELIKKDDHLSTFSAPFGKETLHLLGQCLQLHPDEYCTLLVPSLPSQKLLALLDCCHHFKFWALHNQLGYVLLARVGTLDPIFLFSIALKVQHAALQYSLFIYIIDHFSELPPRSIPKLKSLLHSYLTFTFKI